MTKSGRWNTIDDLETEIINSLDQIFFPGATEIYEAYIYLNSLLTLAKSSEMLYDLEYHFLEGAVRAFCTVKINGNRIHLPDEEVLDGDSWIEYIWREFTRVTSYQECELFHIEGMAIPKVEEEIFGQFTDEFLTRLPLDDYEEIETTKYFSEGLHNWTHQVVMSSKTNLRIDKEDSGKQFHECLVIGGKKVDFFEPPTAAGKFWYVDENRIACKDIVGSPRITFFELHDVGERFIAKRHKNSLS